MKNNMIKGLLYLFINSVIIMISYVSNFQFLPIIGLVYQILGINQLIKGTESNIDFRLARWGIIGSFIAILFTSIYTAQTLMPLIDMNTSPEQIALILEDNFGIIIMILISGIISSTVNFFVLQGLELYTVEDVSLSTKFRVMKFVVVGGIVISLLANLIPILEIVAVALAVFTILSSAFLYWKTRMNLIKKASDL